MSTATAILAYQRMQKNIKVQMKAFSLPRINIKLTAVVVLSLLSLLLLFYVWQINILIRGSYVADTYSQQIDKLMAQNKELEVALAQTSFMGESLAKIEALNFHKATSVRYIKVLDTSLASATGERAN